MLRIYTLSYTVFCGHRRHRHCRRVRCCWCLYWVPWPALSWKSITKTESQNPYFLFCTEERKKQRKVAHTNTQQSMHCLLLLFIRSSSNHDITCVFTLALFSWFYFILLFLFAFFTFVLFIFDFQSCWFCFSFVFSLFWSRHFVHFVVVVVVVFFVLYNAALWPLNVLRKKLLLRCVRIKYLYCSDYKWFSREFLKHKTMWQRQLFTILHYRHMYRYIRLNVHSQTSQTSKYIRFAHFSHFSNGKATFFRWLFERATAQCLLCGQTPITSMNKLYIDY